LNALVFFDDNPAERSIVRQLKPEVAVPEVPSDPAYFIRELESHRYFEAVTVSAEDVQRTAFYRADSQRRALETSAADLDAYLASLSMQARVESITGRTIERAVQLINRSNQFNLTTRRYTNAEMLEIVDNPGWITRTVTLADRFGDSGLISVALARIAGEDLIVDTWLMSCRVLKRGVERLLLNSLVDQASRRGLKRIIGEYIPSKKNSLVRDHYQLLEFSRIERADTEHTYWELRLDGPWEPRRHFIQERVADEPIAV
jgi:FkbH-like protein